MLYENVKEKAAKVPISINELEKRIGIASGSICKWNDIRPSVDKVKRAAEVLGTTIDELMEE